jgi:hypothetical protein
MLIPFVSSGFSSDGLPPRPRADAAKQEQAFCEQEGTAAPWKAALIGSPSL